MWGSQQGQRSWWAQLDALRWIIRVKARKVALRQSGKQAAALRGLHGDRVVSVTGHVPARAIATVRKERVSAGQILLRPSGVDLKIDLIVLDRNGQ